MTRSEINATEYASKSSGVQKTRTPPRAIPTPSSSSASQSSPHVVAQSIESGSASPEISEPWASSTPAPFNSDTSNTPAPGHVVCQPFHRAASAPLLDCERAPEVRKNAGFLGPNSYSNILSEGLCILEPVSTDLDATIGTQQQRIHISNERITQGCKVLAFFRRKSMIHRFIARWYEVCEGTQGIVIEAVMKEWLAKIWLDHGATLTSQEPAKIRKLSELIWRNTLTPLVFNGKTTALEWARLATGPGLRWETLGLIAVNIGLCAIETSESDQLFVEGEVTRLCLINLMKQISEDCLGFCRYCEVLDDLFIWLLGEDSALVGAVKGDRDYSTYRATGEAHSAVIAMGLHQGIKADENVPFFLAEMRKRVFVCAYFQEISVASFLGRPPRLSYRYCTIDPPLDLTERQLVQTGPELEAALASLDKDGYNTAGHLQHAGWTRSYANCAMRREDVIDLALGHYTRDEVLDRAKIIQEKHDAHWSSLPPFLSKRSREPFDFTDPAMAKPLHALQIMVLRNGRRSNELLLQRVLIRKTGATPEKLIATALDIFKDVLQITHRHDIATMFKTSFSFIMSSHGLRSAAIVAIELLKQEMLPQYPERPLLPRSQTIQDLAIFASRLGSVQPTDGCYSVCEQGKRVITKILDRILSPGPPVVLQRTDSGSVCNHAQEQRQLQQPQQGMQGMIPMMDMDGAPMNTLGSMNGMVMGLPDMGYSMGMNVGFGAEPPMSLGQDSDFMRWLDSMEWERMDNWGKL
ncbi:hypothetical protein INS49_003718 [Diaporthe citri]|uniref:uncharacterized protein n=1 Tax=Diaporthe citri TaxID=83186 RepID=UPI001C7EE093|nr:uncharacterized protein INS49_003718 [Diaporthe citri]KAG6355752.1 hypothetical protein INS49_003718 [Diaporthe citri]